VVGEVGLMIAEKDMRGKGLGRTGLLAFLKFVAVHLDEILGEYEEGEEEGLEYLRVMIGGGNSMSIRLFEGVGFRKVREELNSFGEVELRMKGLTVEHIDALLERYGISGCQEIEYHGRLGCV
jgi:hypothetical protein